MKQQNYKGKNKSRLKKILPYVVLVLLAITGIRSYFQENKDEQGPIPAESVQNGNLEDHKDSSSNTNSSAIVQLTKANTVIAYVKKYERLPKYYLTKNEAKKRGWQPHKGNLCEVLPGKAIGGDYFGNREGRLPNRKGRKYYEADINYDCGGRNANRLVYSNDGLIFTTKDHYKTFQKQ
ncbi:ribonuclease domain-containing protein [Mesonia sp. MT50]|uniref:Ribonuclease n=1 Tax=Mesonia profundi TaxID=3070998 RepID=A0ABU0ZZX6_9FLAO|nr:ribonuclease domain-containing protein [Mesonia profundi]MDQ7916996.1 ribonuclease domain-containing protein [Mesonia profundi]